MREDFQLYNKDWAEDYLPSNGFVVAILIGLVVAAFLLYTIGFIYV